MQEFKTVITQMAKLGNNQNVRDFHFLNDPEGNRGIYDNEVDLKLDRKKMSSFLEILDKYINFLKDIDQRIKAGMSYNDSYQRELNDLSFEFLLISHKFENMFSVSLRRKIQHLFRHILGKYIFKSEVLRRYYQKPLGYPGDHLMFETLYDGSAVSMGIGYYFDKFVLNYQLARSVINRKNKMKNLLRNFIVSRKGKKLKILNIGCGSTREIRELLQENLFHQNIQFNFWDQDRSSLEFAKNHMPIVHRKIKFNFANKNVIDMIGFGKPQSTVQIEKQDLISSLGAVDYLGDHMLERFITYFYNALNVGGRLIVSCCSSRDAWDYLLLTWFGDWHFYLRDASTTKILIEKLGVKYVKIEWEVNKQIFFIILGK